MQAGWPTKGWKQKKTRDTYNAQRQQQGTTEICNKKKEIKTLPREEQKTTETKEWHRKLFWFYQTHNSCICKIVISDQQDKTCPKTIKKPKMTILFMENRLIPTGEKAFIWSQTGPVLHISAWETILLIWG